MIISFNYRLDFVDTNKESISAFFRGAASRPAGLPRYGQGRRSRPRPAKRRRLSCKPIEKVHKRTPLITAITALRKKNRRLHSI